MTSPPHDTAVARADYDAIETRYRAVIEAAVEGIVIIDERGTIETFNPAAERIFAYAAREVTGRNVNVLMPEPDAGRHDGYMRRYLDGGDPHIIGIGRLVWGRRKSGEVFPLELAVAELDTREPPRRFVGTIRDVTERRRLEDALAAREQELRLLFEYAPIGVFAAATSGRFVRVNPALCTLVGYEAAALTELSVSDLTVAEDRAILRSAYVDVCEGNKAECRCDLRWQRRDGSIAHVSVHAVLAADGALLIGQVLDRTEHVHSEREMREIGARLAQVGRVTTLGEMASAIAHEINQPLTAISAYAQACRRLLEQGAPEPELLRETLDAIVGQALRAGDVVRRIRGFVTHHDSAREPVDLNDIVRSALVFADFDLASHEVTVATDLIGGLPAVIADPIQLQQVCLNLIRNAIDAMNDQPAATRRLNFATRLRPEGVVVRCADSGPGVAPEMRERLFQPFQTTKREGMGMGLSISASIVAAHGGVLRHAEDAHTGAAFELVLPTVLE